LNQTTENNGVLYAKGNHMNEMIAFGPVPSRRLGCSLGINNIPPKHCSYSCIYCQVGRTQALEITRREFYSVDTLARAVDRKIRAADLAGLDIDFLTFVPDGEPTLDLNLYKEIEMLQRFGFPIAVISNAAFIDHEEVRQALYQADWVSLKVDSVDAKTWHKINRPHGSLRLETILNGIRIFANQFKGELVTETMLVRDINDREEDIAHLAAFLIELQPFKAYLSIPTRPPAEKWVNSPSFAQLRSAYQYLVQKISSVELLVDQEEDLFISTGQLTEDILSITAVHPVTELALKKMVLQANGDWSTIDRLVLEGKLERLFYQDQVYYRKNFSSYH
jgi:wyosine [tRNA(Phe)-imidazoG37] synthetase (radical SAM superfamily)